MVWPQSFYLTLGSVERLFSRAHECMQDEVLVGSYEKSKALKDLDLEPIRISFVEEGEGSDSRPEQVTNYAFLAKVETQSQIISQIAHSIKETPRNADEKLGRGGSA